MNVSTYSYGVGAITSRHHHRKTPVKTLTLMCLKNGIKYRIKSTSFSKIAEHLKQEGLTSENGWVLHGHVKAVR